MREASRQAMAEAATYREARMARALALALMVVLAACGPRTAPGRSEADTQTWRPGVTKDAWLIGGHLDTRRVRSGLASRPEHEVFITVNGRVAMQGGVPRSRAVELAGHAEGANVSAVCTPRLVAAATLQVSCLVMVADLRVSTLTFTAGTARRG